MKGELERQRFPEGKETKKQRSAQPENVREEAGEQMTRMRECFLGMRLPTVTRESGRTVYVPVHSSSRCGQSYM